jgi:hypothetical protein
MIAFLVRAGRFIGRFGRRRITRIIHKQLSIVQSEADPEVLGAF